MAKARMIWLDGLRLLAGVSMVGLHATSDAQGLPWVDYDVSDRWGPLFIRTVLYVARTELFLIISLFLLLLSLDKRPRGYQATIAEQARRLLVPFVFWTVFFAFYNLIKANAFQYGPWAVTQLMTPRVWLEYLLLGTSKYHMHFLPTLFGLILFYPLFLLAKSKPWLGVLVLAALVCKREIDGFIWANYYDSDALAWALRATKIVTYCGYGMVAGAAVSLWQNGFQGQRLFLACAVVGCGLFAIKIHAMALTAHSGAWPFQYTPGYWADFLMPAVLFLGVMAVSAARWPSVLSRLAPYSFGIYLCHPIFLDLAEIGLRDVAWSPTAIVVTKIAFAVVLTSILVRALSRSAVLGWTVGLGPLPRMTFLKTKGANQC